MNAAQVTMHEPESSSSWWRRVYDVWFAPVAQREKKTLGAVQAMLEPDEKILASAWGHIAQYGLFKGGVLVATNQRVIRYAKTPFGFDCISCDYSKIEFVLEEAGFYGRRVILSFHSAVIAFFPSVRGKRKKQLKQVLDIIRSSSRSKEEAPGKTVEGNSIAERLRDLHALHKEGVLTDEEYATRKKLLVEKI